MTWIALAVASHALVFAAGLACGLAAVSILRLIHRYTGMLGHHV